MKTKNKYRVYPKTGQEYHFLSALKAFDPNATTTKDGDTLIVDTYLNEFDIKFTSVLRVDHYLQIALRATAFIKQSLTLKEIQDMVKKCRHQSPVVYPHSYTLKSKNLSGNDIKETNVNLLYLDGLHVTHPPYSETTKMYLRHINPHIDSICDSVNAYPIVDVILDDACEIVLVYNE